MKECITLSLLKILNRVSKMHISRYIMKKIYRNGNNIVDTFMFDNNVISDPYKIANKFNQKNFEVGPSFASSITYNNGDVFYYLDSGILNSILLSSIN